VPRGVTSLSRQRIVEAAAALAEQRGIEALTMRDLAASLGVGTMSLYHHMPDKLALQQALADHIWSQLVLPSPEDCWEQRMGSLARQLWQAARRHPALVPLLLTRRFTGPEGLPAVEALLTAARDAGFDPPATVKCFRVLTGYAVGVAQAESVRATARRDDARRARRADSPAGDGFPNLRAVLDGAHHNRPDDEFEFGLHILITGLRDAAKAPSLPTLLPPADGRSLADPVS
jgi:AcrR family transcriptional regulator